MTLIFDKNEIPIVGTYKPDSYKQKQISLSDKFYESD